MKKKLKKNKISEGGGTEQIRWKIKNENDGVHLMWAAARTHNSQHSLT